MDHAEKRCIPPHRAFGGSIDQGATHLGGYRSGYMHRWGLPFFAWFLLYRETISLLRYVFRILYVSRILLFRYMCPGFIQKGTGMLDDIIVWCNCPATLTKKIDMLR